MNRSSGKTATSLTKPLQILALLLCCLMINACSTRTVTRNADTAGKVVLTPLTGVRDIVDAPLVTVANTFEYFAEQSHLAKAPTASGGYSIKGGFNAGIGYDFSYILFKGVSWIVGGVDYVICRSIWPNYPNGISPWSQKGYGWGDLYFPNSRVLWGDMRPLQQHREPQDVLVE